MTASALLFDFGETLARVHPYSEWLYVRACREFRATRYVQFDPGRDDAYELDLDARPWALQ